MLKDIFTFLVAVFLTALILGFGVSVGVLSADLLATKMGLLGICLGTGVIFMVLRFWGPLSWGD